MLTRVETEEKLLKTGFICFLDQLQEKGGGWGTVGIAGTFLWNSVRMCKYQKWGDHQETKYFIDNVVQALITFKDGHRRTY